MTDLSTSISTKLSRALTFNGADWTRPILIAASILFSILVWQMFAFRYEFPATISNRFDFPGWINTGEEWLQANVKWLTRAIAGYVTSFIDGIEEWLWFAPWPLVVTAMGLISLRYGGLRFALFAVFATMFWGIVDQWDPAMSTLALMGVSVLISVLIGVPVGILSSQSDRFEAFIKPILDTMQTMPAFVYLIPAVFFFGVGATGAAMAIIIYAMPPVVRLTNLGIRQVPATTIEVADSFGSTRLQTIAKVQIPQAIPSIILGVNQTIMMALGLAVLAVFIGTGGLGMEVYKSLTRLKVGWAFEAGMCIVFMAILFDRLTLAMSRQNLSSGTRDRTELQFRLLPQSWIGFPPALMLERGIDAIWRTIARAGTAIADGMALILGAILGTIHKDTGNAASAWVRRSKFLVISILILFAIWAWNAWIAKIGFFPGTLQFSIRDPIDNFVDWLAVEPFFVAFSKGLRAGIYLYLLNPLDKFFVGLPWFYTLAALFLIAWTTGTLRFAFVVTVMMFLTAVAGIWVETMETMSATITAVAICILIGLPTGIIAAYSKVVDSIVRPILDTMQTMPAFVYLIPVLMLFGGNKVTAIIATVVYAIPPMVRMTILGLRQLPEQVDEVCESFGSTGLQSLIKVKLPMASPAIMLGVNQCIVMALAMQVITPLVAGEGLGKIVFGAMTLADTGTGLVAGIAIVMLAIVLDRLTEAWSANQKRALGL